MTDQDEQAVEVVLNARGADATGVLRGGGLTVRAGSQGPMDSVPSFPATDKRRRDSLLDDGTLATEGETVVFTRDHHFESPSAAAAVLMGRSSNGWIDWKTSDGQPIGQLRAVPWRERESDFRRRWYEAHANRFHADPEMVEQPIRRQQDFTASAAEALGLLSTLTTTRDVETFVAGLRQWAVKPTTLEFNGFNGQMLVNQLVGRSDDPAELTDVLVDALTTPTDPDGAKQKLQRIVDYIERIRVGAHPASGRAPFLVSYFWSLADHQTWPTMWASGALFAEFCTGRSLPTDPVERYVAFHGFVDSVEDDYERFERVASWWDSTRPALLDGVLIDRCRYGLDRDGPGPDGLAANADSLVAVGRHIGSTLVERVAEAIGRSVVAKRPPKVWAADRPRSDTWADWRVHDSGLGVRLWVSDLGATIGLTPGQLHPGWYDEVRGVVERAGLAGFEIVGTRGSGDGEGVAHAGGRKGGFTYARRFEPEELGDLDVEAEVTSVAAVLHPVLDELMRLATGESPPAADDQLAPLVEQFRDRGYPTPADMEHRADRERFATMLAPDAIALVDPAELRRIWTRRYGSPGPQSILNTSLRDADAAEYDRIVDVISYLCWGDGDDAERIDAVLDPEGERYVKGLGESVVMKLLSITHPDRYVPVYPFRGPMGKLRMLQLLDLPEPEPDSRGRLQVEANDMLRERLDRFFPGDPWGMGQFLYRYAESEEGVDDATAEIDLIEEVADELLVDRSFLDDIVALLEDKGQVILYGPPGTGKTYLARKLAEALVPDITRRALVQFHPSMSYEDFFEGYRPETSADGKMTYRLTPGPLALLAGRAADAPGKRHLMIIDEINRANLPRVFGELLFLLEYRDEQVPTLYRSDDPFELPSELWFIGTMNTADRSIALVDAALRRRFHFVPFFPDRGPMQGLLDRWLARHREPAWVGELVAMVNDELTEALGGPHLQLGASHFMRAGLDEEPLRRIWEYNIEPFIEDQFFGDPGQIDRFRFGAVFARYLGGLGVANLDELAAVQEGTAAPVVEVDPEDE